MADHTDTDSDDDTCEARHPFHHMDVDDDRLQLLSSGSMYSDIDNANNIKGKFDCAKYCAVHFNIHVHSFASKFEQLKVMVGRLNNTGIKVHFILLCETFLMENNAHLYNIPGYSFIHKCRNTLSKGGVAMYILNEFNFREIPDLVTNIEGEFECICAEIEVKQDKRNLIIAEIYRIPNTNERQSIARYDEVMSSLVNTKCDILLGTNQNFDYVKVNSNANVSELLDVFFTQGILPTVTKPTRITHSSATLIDNIYVKCDMYQNIHSLILFSDISDHFPILTCMGQKRHSRKKEPLTFTQRHVGPEQIHRINDALLSTTWGDLLTHTDINQCYSTFLQYFMNVLNDCAPEINITIPYKSVIKLDWMTPSLIKCSRKCEQLFKKAANKSKDSLIHLKYSRYINIFYCAKRTAKKKILSDNFK